MADHRDTSPAKSQGRLRIRKWILPVGLIFGVLAMMAGTICSGLNRVNDLVTMNNCAAGLRQLGFAIEAYSADNHGEPPPPWREVARTQEITAELFVCPDHHGEGPAPGPGREWADRLDNPPGKYCAYVLVTGQLPAHDPKAVLAFERVGGHPSQGVNILFADEHVETLRIGSGAADKITYDHLVADFAAGVRPLKLRL